MKISCSKKATEKIILRLFIAGGTSRSARAINNLQKICAEHLGGKSYEVEVIDVRKNPGIAKQEQIIALPTLMSKLPKSMRQIIGDLSDKEKVLSALEIISSVYWESSDSIRRA